MTTQGLLQASLRSYTGTTSSFNGDLMAFLINEGGSATADLNGNLYGYLKKVLGITTEVYSLNDLQQRFAIFAGYGNWNAVTDLVAASLSQNFLTNSSLTSPQGITLGFSRASGATQYDSFGDVVFAPENLVGFSEDISNTSSGGWTKRTNYSVTAYSGDLPSEVAQAWTLVNAGNVNTGEGTFNNATAGLANGLYTCSVWLKAGTLSTGRIILKNASSDTIITASNVDLTSDWQRFSVSGLTTGTTGGYRFEINTNGVTGNIHMAGAQVARCGYIRTYNRTTGSAYYGARFDYYPNGVVFTGENMFRYSQELNNAVWTKSGTTITANAALAPDGTMTADKVSETAAGGSHQLSQPVSVTNFVTGNVVTNSFYIKPDGRSTIFVSFVGTSTFYGDTNIDLLTDSRSVAVGDGWYRVSITGTASGFGTAILYVGPTNNGVKSYTGDGVSGFYLWGVQSERTLTASTYTPTTASAITGTASATARGLRIEESRVNLIADSQNYTTASWNRVDTTATANSITSPCNALDATLLTEGTAGNAAVISATATITAGATVTGSVFVRRGNHDWIALLVANTGLSNAFVGYFNTATGAFGTTATAAGTATFANAEVMALKNGWWRIGITGTLAGADTTAVVFTRSASTDNSTTRVNSSTRYLWGSQVEQTTTPNNSTARMTSYIPTGSTSVTRAADISTTVIGAEYNQTEGTIVMNWEQMFVNTNAGARSIAVSIDDNTTNNRNYIFANGGSGITKAGTTVSGVTTADLGAGVAVLGTIYKTAYRYKANDFSMVQNGTLISTDVSGAVPSGITQRRIGHRGSDYLNGWIRSYSEYTTGLSNSTMQGLTS